MGEDEHAFVVDSRLITRVTELANCGSDEVVFVLGGGTGQLTSSLGCASRIITVEPDRSIANYLYSLELYHNTVVTAQPHMVLSDIPFDKLICLQPHKVHLQLLDALLRVPFSQGVLVAPDELLGAFRARDRLGVLLRASLDLEIIKSVPKTAYSPVLSFPVSLVSLTPTKLKDPISLSLQLLLREAGTMRGLLTRSCREYFAYTLAEAQEAVRLLDKELLKKRFWEIDDAEFKAVHEWLKLG